MDHVRRIKKQDEVDRQRSRSFGGARSSRTRGSGPVSWKAQSGKTKSMGSPADSADEDEAHEPRVVQLNLKATLMGVHIFDDDEELFFSRQSSMSSMISDKCRKVVGKPSERVESSSPTQLLKQKNGSPVATFTMLHPGSKAKSVDLNSQPLGEHGESRYPSGMLYPSPQFGSTASSSVLDTAHFIFGDVSPRATDPLTEKIFNNLVGKSRLQRRGECDGENSRKNQQFQSGAGVTENENSHSPVSILDHPVSCPASPTCSEKFYPYESTRSSLQGQCQTAAGDLLPQTGVSSRQLDSQISQHSMAIMQISDRDIDDDDIFIEDDIIFEGPYEFARHHPNEHQYHPGFPMVEGYTSSQVKSKPTLERWSSNSKSWNLSLGQEPREILSTNLINSGYNQFTDAGRSARTSSCRDTPISLSSSFDAGSRRLKRGMCSSFKLDQSRWMEFESERNDFVINSGRLQIDVDFEPDLDEPDLEQVNNVNRYLQNNRVKVNEEDFPFDSPIASSFVFGDSSNRRHQDAQPLRPSFSAMYKSDFPVIDYEDDDLDHSDAYHDPDDGIYTDSDSSLTTFSLEADSIGLLDQPPQWVSARSFSYVKEVVDRSNGLSSRALSGCLELGRSGRFSVDLQRGRNLADDHPRKPDVRIKLIKTEKPSRRSILSPCLSFLQRQRNVPRLRQAPVAAPTLQAINSFTARLGPLAEVSPRLETVNSFTARLGYADSPSRLQTINSFTARLGPLAALRTPPDG